MTWIPIHLCLLLVACYSSLAVAFTLKQDVEADGQTQGARGLHRIRSSDHEEKRLPIVQDNDSQHRQAAHNQQTSQQVHNREVKSKHRLRSDWDFTPTDYREDKFENSRRVLRAENSIYQDEENEIGHSEALSQDVQRSDILSSVPKMVVVVSTTVAAFFGMCVMAAIFQCCCRKKRTTSESEDADAIKTEKEEKQKSKTPSPEKDTPKPEELEEKTENDKLLEDDDLGDFSVVMRETEILKSFRKPPPPKNRARASRAPRMKAAASKEDGFSLIKEEGEGSIKSKSGSQRSSPEKKDSKDELCEPTKEEKRNSFEAAKLIVDSMFAEVKDKRETTPVVVEPEEPSKEVPEEASKAKSVQSNGGNIFMQIDPTVKIEDPSEKKTSRIPVRSSPQSSPPSSSKEGASLRPSSANKDQRKFLVPSVHGEQMDQLVKSLKTRLKEDKPPTCQSARNLATNKVVPSGSEDDVEPLSRERSHSDPTKNLLGVKQTHV
ncbi:serine/arginine repetitive matrix protein 1-like [Haliotis rubra]|uniref:serine/arginine repetitive matrix protein 1-like n=1 Tax=Haliotis rubra TaxID=36100 RepID=UPI001EE51B83|nr:serine/arginine repetitive matrix protein 1-like [Haliotis rubra]XP_046566505.1 serine/arginine repetitive matrix protein 1-like [Haliotis rubra]XP_046566506.1 serine/arginine repetitive matrix protein 1-like [Haliotis rubra]